MDKHLTSIEYMEWQRERDAKKDDFPYIRLSRKELKLLENISTEEIKIDSKNRADAIHLRDLVFINIFTADCSDKENIEFCQIRERGRNYLVYIKEERKKERRSTIRFYITTVITTIAAVAAVAGVLIQLALRR